MPDPLGMVRVAVVSPAHTPGNPRMNARHFLQIMEQLASQYTCEIVLFPELAITGYTCQDLFFSRTFQQEAESAIFWLAEQMQKLPIPVLTCVGGLLFSRDRLWSGAWLLGPGKVYAFIPKGNLPARQEYYDYRWFTPASRQAFWTERGIPVGKRIVLEFSGSPFPLRIGVEICEDAWHPLPPSLELCAHLQTHLILNPSASNEILGKSSYRRQLVRSLSGMGICGYMYASTGPRESTADTVFGGHLLIAENGIILQEDHAFSLEDRWIIADIDVERLKHDRHWHTSYPQDTPEELPGTQVIPIVLPERSEPDSLHRPISPHPFVPDSPEARHRHCQEIIQIQTTALARRLQHTGARKVVLGVSGGLDSTHALLVCYQALQKIGQIPQDSLIPVWLPGPGSSRQTYLNARTLTESLKLPLKELPIHELTEKSAQILTLQDTHSVAFENLQARMRTTLLLTLANQMGGIMVGTSDLSELALGWCTYGGDHMAMYQINAGVPKTLIRYLIEWFRDEIFADQPEVQKALTSVLETPITPELIPPPPGKEEITQKTEEILGPYEVHDFFLYYWLRFHFSARKILYLAKHAFRTRYSDAELHRWWEIFSRRFLFHQFKRNALPDGPKVGTVALSPRADWRMPSDISYLAGFSDFSDGASSEQ